MSKITACLIVKNEEAHLERCLKSLRGKVDEIVVVDTGSTDRTVEIASRFNAKIVTFQWTNNFSDARNESLKHATSEWILWIDADEELVCSNKSKLKKIISADKFDVFLMKITSFVGDAENGSESNRNHAIRLFKNDPQYRFYGRIHEQIVTQEQVNDTRIGSMDYLEILHYGYLQEIKENKNKFQRNKELLEEELKENPEDAFHWFNLGMEYYTTQNFQEAKTCFEKSLKFSSTSAFYYPRLLRNAANSLYNLNEFGKAEELCNRAIQLFPDYTDIWFVSSFVLEGQNKVNDAIVSLERCLQLGESKKFESLKGVGSYKALYKLGELYSKTGNAGKAIEVLNQGALQYPQHLHFFTDLSQIYLQTNQVSKAAAILKKGAKFHPQLLEVAKRAEEFAKKLKGL
ncbi:glycosyltransferase [Brevibacillus nitrificans]|uniref:glycosyltransferase n=1 Tax=Brevibacillus nitrificans TaxID=651560 RepID=UPI002E22A8E5|nr:glycosyltransferase [Brevibacillus nitrificans]